MAAGGLTFKAVLVGDSGVGKTTIWRDLQGLPFVDDTSQLPHPNSLASYAFKVPNPTKNGQVITLEVIDSGGEERFRDFTVHHYQHGSAIVFVYAVNSQRSFQSLSKWIGQAGAGFLTTDYLSYVIGNKDDLTMEHYVDSILQGSLGVYKGFETSAKCNPGEIQQIFSGIAVTLHDRHMARYHGR